MADIEKRSYIGEVRAEENESEPTHIIGYGSVFNSRSEPLWGFREIIKPGAFDSVLEDDVRGLFNHDPNFILGRSKSGTLTLSVDEQGLRYDITAPNTPTIRDLVIAPLKRGILLNLLLLFVSPKMGRNGMKMMRALLFEKFIKYQGYTM
nr:HK97 family phage prohead protease [Phocoenobacter uteri]